MVEQNALNIYDIIEWIKEIRIEFIKENFLPRRKQRQLIVLEKILADRGYVTIQSTLHGDSDEFRFLIYYNSTERYDY